MHGIDPFGCVLDKFAAVFAGGDWCYDCVDEVEVEDGVVLAEFDGFL